MAKRWLTVLLVVLSVALVAAVVLWLARDDDSSSAAAEPEIVAASQLPATERGKTVYWLGERPGTRYELTETSAGRVYIRYLTGDAEAGDDRTAFVTVATYPEEDGIAALRRAAREQEGAKLGRTEDGAVLLVDPTSPNNAHLAYPGTNLQIEVYSPVPGQALRLASRGAVQPVP